jgi:acetolactate synthase-1/2/3 large subunit
MVSLASAYGIPAAKVEGQGFGDMLDHALAADGPFLSEVLLDGDQPFEPKLSSRSLPDGRIVSSPLEDLHPFLSREELLENMLIPPVEQ